MIKLVALRAKTDLDIPKTFSVGDLCKRHAKKMIEAREFSDFEIATILFHTATKGLQWHEIHNL
jgi:hypothetical protein